MTSNHSGSEEKIIAHYEKYDESERLKHDIGPFEQARTQELILRCLPPPPAVLMDVAHLTENEPALGPRLLALGRKA